jgi:hypothetical protein
MKPQVTWSRFARFVPTSPCGGKRRGYSAIGAGARSIPTSDSSDYSFGYVANWAGGGEPAIARITASCQNIQKAAVNILGHFEVGEQEVAA